MKSIEIICDGFTYRHDFPAQKSINEDYVPPLTVEEEADTSAGDALDVCLHLLRCCYGPERVRKALEELSEVDYDE